MASQTPATRNRLLQAILLVVVLILVVTTVVMRVIHGVQTATGLADFFGSGTGCLGPTPYSPDTIGKISKLKLPTGIADLSARSMALPTGCTVFLSFTINAQDLSEFLKTTSIREPLTTTTTLPPDIAIIATPIRKMTYLVGRGVTSDAQQLVTIDNSDPAHYKVYFVTAMR